MAANRKAAEQSILADIEAFLPGSKNPAILTRMFSEMDDDEFELFMTRIENGEHSVPVIVPEMVAPMISVRRNLDLGKQWGHEWFERIWMDGENGSAPYLSNHKYLVVLLPLKRQVQFLTKKISIPEDSRTIDNLTGQVTGKSKGSKFSYPEMQIANSLNLDKTIIEFTKVRGGDLGAYNALSNLMTTQGGASLAAVSSMGTRVKSQQTLSAFLTSMHLANTA